MCDKDGNTDQDNRRMEHNPQRSKLPLSLQVRHLNDIREGKDVNNAADSARVPNDIGHIRVEDSQQRRHRHDDHREDEDRNSARVVDKLLPLDREENLRSEQANDEREDAAELVEEGYLGRHRVDVRVREVVEVVLSEAVAEEAVGEGSDSGVGEAAHGEANAHVPEAFPKVVSIAGYREDKVMDKESEVHDPGKIDRVRLRGDIPLMNGVIPGSTFEDSGHKQENDNIKHTKNANTA